MLRQYLAIDGLAQRRGAGLRATQRGMGQVRFMHGGQGDRGTWLRADIRAALEDPVLLVDWAEQVVELGDVFRHAQEQIAARAQRIVEGGDDLFLDASAEIDQQIAARYQVDPGKRRVAQHIVRRENAQVAHRLADHVTVAIGHEIALAPRCRYPVKQGGGISRRPRHGQGAVVDVGGENLHAGRRRQGVQVRAPTGVWFPSRRGLSAVAE
ncbi:hypothetical protein G6F35_013785 [Rhizopus arrhizus]|nr:hypothetical protein G6F35_013785 [Rhizopus arrhizus]